MSDASDSESEAYAPSRPFPPGESISLSDTEDEVEMNEDPLPVTPPLSPRVGSGSSGSGGRARLSVGGGGPPRVAMMSSLVGSSTGSSGPSPAAAAEGEGGESAGQRRKRPRAASSGRSLSMGGVGPSSSSSAFASSSLSMSTSLSTSAAAGVREEPKYRRIYFGYYAARPVILGPLFCSTFSVDEVAQIQTEVGVPVEGRVNTWKFQFLAKVVVREPQELKRFKEAVGREADDKGVENFTFIHNGEYKMAGFDLDTPEDTLRLNRIHFSLWRAEVVEGTVPGTSMDDRVKRNDAPGSLFWKNVRGSLKTQQEIIMEMTEVTFKSLKYRHRVFVAGANGRVARVEREGGMMVAYKARDLRGAVFIALIPDKEKYEVFQQDMQKYWPSAHLTMVTSMKIRSKADEMRFLQRVERFKVNHIREGWYQLLEGGVLDIFYGHMVAENYMTNRKWTNIFAFSFSGSYVRPAAGGGGGAGGGEQQRFDFAKWVFDSDRKLPVRVLEVMQGEHTHRLEYVVMSMYENTTAEEVQMAIMTQVRNTPDLKFGWNDMVEGDLEGFFEGCKVIPIMDSRLVKHNICYRCLKDGTGFTRGGERNVKYMKNPRLLDSVNVLSWNPERLPMMPSADQEKMVRMDEKVLELERLNKVLMQAGQRGSSGGPSGGGAGAAGGGGGGEAVEVGSVSINLGELSGLKRKLEDAELKIQGLEMDLAGVSRLREQLMDVERERDNTLEQLRRIERDYNRLRTSAVVVPQEVYRWTREMEGMTGNLFESFMSLQEKMQVPPPEVREWLAQNGRLGGGGGGAGGGAGAAGGR